MKRNALLPLAIMPEVMLAILLWLPHNLHVPDWLLGGGAGVLIGLSFVSIIAMTRSKVVCARFAAVRQLSLKGD